MMNRVRCSDCVTENQNLVSEIPLSTSIRSNSGAWAMNCSYSGGDAKPMTRSTPARCIRPVEEHHFPGGGEVHHEALEVPLVLLAVAGLRQGHRPGVPGIEVLHEPLDRPALAGIVTALEQQHVLALRLRRPGLELQ